LDDLEINRCAPKKEARISQRRLTLAAQKGLVFRLRHEHLDGKVKLE
jgi:hypothetical protein